MTNRPHRHRGTFFKDSLYVCDECGLIYEAENFRAVAIAKYPEATQDYRLARTRVKNAYDRAEELRRQARALTEKADKAHAAALKEAGGLLRFLPKNFKPTDPRFRVQKHWLKTSK